MKISLSILLVFSILAAGNAPAQAGAAAPQAGQEKTDKKDEAKKDEAKKEKQESEPELIDEKTIEKLTELSQQGERAYQDGKHQDSIDAFLGFLKLLPAHKQFNNPRAQAHYYIACNYSLIEKKKEAIEQLDKAFEFGFRRYDYIEADEDLKSIRSSPEVAALVAKYQKVDEEELQKFDFKLKTIDGKPVAKKDFIGQVLIIDIWGTWCPPCRMEVPHFIALQKKYADNGLKIVGLNWERGAEDEEGAKKIVADFIKTSGINYPCAIATEEILESVPNFSGFPTTLFVGRDGRIRKKVSGYHELEDLEAIVKPLLEEKAPEKAPEDK